MNNKGFNWFFPIAILGVILFFGSNMFSDAGKNENTKLSICFTPDWLMDVTKACLKLLLLQQFF